MGYATRMDEITIAISLKIPTALRTKTQEKRHTGNAVSCQPFGVTSIRPKRSFGVENFVKARLHLVDQNWETYAYIESAIAKMWLK